jgi:CRISPR/Cas system endoribonuclease Cas6 (RAMP superfamily)
MEIEELAEMLDKNKKIELENVDIKVEQLELSG